MSTTFDAPSSMAWTLTVAFLDLWHAAPFGVRPDDELPEGLRDQLTSYRASLDVILPGAGRLPLGAIHTFLECWVQLYGLVAMEVFDHLHFCLADVGPFFQVTLGSIAGRLGMDMERLIADLEIDLLKQALEKSRYSQKKAARLLGLTPRSLRYRLQKHGLEAQ